MRFNITHQDAHSPARCGRLELAHGTVETPVFMPVGTQGTVKGITPRALEECGTSIILANTYHLALRPGTEVVRRAGGLHNFAAWPHPILTDSGGYQVFSLSALNKIDDDGVTFRSHIDGAEMRLSPEASIRLQNDLGADVIMAFDECPPATASRDEVARAVDRTTRWAERSRNAHQNQDQALFGIMQGGLFEDLRRRSAEPLRELDFAGYAIGGVSVGESPEDIRRIVALAAPLLPEGRPRYLMGVGTPTDLVDLVGQGVDLFDCVLPTRNARNANLFIRGGSINMRNQRHAQDFSPIDTTCACYACTTFTRAYIRHLYVRGEMLGPILGSVHNLTFFQTLMTELREAIRASRYRQYRAEFAAGIRDAG